MHGTIGRRRLPGFLMLIGGAVWGLAGCGADNPPAASSSGVVVLNGSSVADEGKRLVSAAVAADMRYAFDELAAEFMKDHPDIHVTPVFGSSGNLFTQLSKEAPFDLYLSADVEYARRLAADGKGVTETVFSYAVGHIVVWVRNESKLDVAKGIEVLKDPSIQKIAIANPQHAPYGRAAEAAMKKLGVYEQVQDRLVLGENIAQTAQYVESGAADVGIIALSLVMAPAMKDKGRYWAVPLDAYPKLEQGGVMLKWARDPAAVEQLRNFIMSERGRSVLKQYGFLQPTE